MLFSPKMIAVALLFTGLFVGCFTGALVSPAHAKPLGMMTGSKAGTYYAVGKEIAKAASKANIAIKVRPSKGSIDNLQKMADTRENAALGIVQADILAFLQRSNKPESKDIMNRLRMVMPLFKEEIHILALKDIGSLEDLNDKRVVVGSSGSGSMMTAVNLFAQREIKPSNLYQVEAAEAVVAVMAGRAEAMVFVGGKPVPMFKNLENLKGVNHAEMTGLLEKVHFVPMELTEEDSIYETAEITADDYQFVTSAVPTLAVRSVLVSYDFTLKDTAYYRQRCKQLAHLGKVLYQNLPALKEKGHAKWQEVDVERNLTFWKRDACVWPTVKATIAEMDAKRAEKKTGLEPVQVRQSELEKELLSIITNGQ